MDFRIKASGICRIIVPPSVSYLLCSLFGTLAGWSCCGTSKIAQTAQLVCFMVVFYYRLDVWISGCTARELDGFIDGYFFSCL